MRAGITAPLHTNADRGGKTQYCVTTTPVTGTAMSWRRRLDQIRRTIGIGVDAGAGTGAGAGAGAGAEAVDTAPSTKPRLAPVLVKILDAAPEIKAKNLPINWRRRNWRSRRGRLRKTVGPPSGRRGQVPGHGVPC